MQVQADLRTLGRSWVMSAQPLALRTGQNGISKDPRDSA